MADTIVLPSHNGSRVMGKIMQRLARGTNITTGVDQGSGLRASRVKRRCWTMKDADPAVAAASAAVAPVVKGDWAYRIDSDEVFLCSVSPAASTAASFIQCHA